MRLIVVTTLATVIVGRPLHAQPPGPITDKCKAQIVNPRSTSEPVRAKGATYAGYKRSPIIAFEVDEAGTLSQLKIKRHSGSQAADELALASVKNWKYKPRPGCGVLQSEVLVTIDFAATD